MSEAAPTPNDPHSTAQDPLLQRVERLLQRRGELAPALAGFADELPAGRSRHSIRRVLALLESGASAEAICSSTENVQVLLPLLAEQSDPRQAAASLHRTLLESIRVAELHRQRRRVLAYPLAVCLIAIPVVVFLCVTVVPVYSDIFSSFGIELPFLTEAVVGLSQWILRAPIFFAATVVLAIAAGYACYLLFRLATSWFDAAFGYLTRGSSQELTAMASFVRRLSEGVSAGLPLPFAIDLAGRLNDRKPIRDAARWLAIAASQGDLGLDKSAAAARFPATLIYALQNSPTPASPLLDELAANYLERVAERMNWNTGVMGQAAIVVVGVLVGVIVLAMLLPLVSLINGLSG